MKKTLVEVAGWYGTVAIVGAYALVSFSVLKSSSFWYQLLNLTGSLGIVVVAWSKKVYQPVVTNVIWAAIAAVAVINMLR